MIDKGSIPFDSSEINLEDFKMSKKLKKEVQRIMKFHKPIDESTIPNRKGLMKVLDNIWNFIYFKTIIGDLIEKIPAIIKWIPVIWSTKVWDNSGIYNILLHHLKQMEKCILNGYHADRFETAKEIKEVEIACERILENNYCKKEWKNYNKKYPKAWKFKTKIDKKTGHKILVFPKGKQRSESHRIVNLSDSKREKDMKFVSDSLFEKSDGWWE